MSMADAFATAELCEPCPNARHERQEAAIVQHETRLTRVLATVAPIALAGHSNISITARERPSDDEVRFVLTANATKVKQALVDQVAAEWGDSASVAMATTLVLDEQNEYAQRPTLTVTVLLGVQDLAAPKRSTLSWFRLGLHCVVLVLLLAVMYLVVVPISVVLREPAINTAGDGSMMGSAMQTEVVYTTNPNRRANQSPPHGSQQPLFTLQDALDGGNDQRR
jgi:hypothetical protein